MVANDRLVDSTPCAGNLLCKITKYGSAKLQEVLAQLRIVIVLRHRENELHKKRQNTIPTCSSDHVCLTCCRGWHSRIGLYTVTSAHTR
uniref:Uncharacterized protein n=1 Tax=Arion vulgaris TaxID=1028688 RepID=A0A0B7BBD7_9EUPU